MRHAELWLGGIVFVSAVALLKAYPYIRDRVQTPPPAAYLVAFGETSLEFELRCVVAEVEKGLSVRSELHYAIIQKFREAGIGRFGPKIGDT